MRNILCLYYTRTGLTKKLMKAIAEKLEADSIEYTDGIDRSGVRGYIGCCFASFSKKYPAVNDICPPKPLSSYSHVIIGMPIWAESACPVGKGFLKKYKDELPANVHFVITHMANADYTRAINKLDALLKAPHVSHLSVSTQKVDPNGKIEAFISTIH